MSHNASYNRKPTKNSRRVALVDTSKLPVDALVRLAALISEAA